MFISIITDSIFHYVDKLVQQDHPVTLCWQKMIFACVHAYIIPTQGRKTRQCGRVHQLPVYHILQMNIFISCYVPVMSLNPAVSPIPFRLKKKTPHRNSLIHKHLLTRFHFIIFFQSIVFTLLHLNVLFILYKFFFKNICFPNYCGPFLVLRSRDKY